MVRSVRTRFAPSPTGALHIGSVRTALFAWLFARRHNGRFVLRIEDTDQRRSSGRSEQAILEGLAWLGLRHDDHELYHQTRRLEKYQDAARRLIDRGLAYYCYCSADELKSMREEQIARGMKPRYDGRCRNRRGEPPKGVRPVVRFKQCAEGEVVFEDLVHGTIRVANAELDDLILLRSDGQPTYNLSVVVDDADMRISCVIRGDDHLSNTPRQINIWRALFGRDAVLPEYAHVPMILAADGSRLSKRTDATALDQYRKAGYLPEAMINYLARLGWSHGDQEIFSLDELIGLFDLKDVHAAPASLDPKKLDWLNRHYMRHLPAAALRAPFERLCREAGITTAESPDTEEVIDVLRSRYSTIGELAEGSRFFYESPVLSEDDLAKRVPQDLLLEIRTALDALEDWRAASVKQCLHRIAERQGAGFGKVGKPLRYILTGGAPSPDLPTTMHILGRSACERRLECALDMLQRARNGGIA